MVIALRRGRPSVHTKYLQLNALGMAADDTLANGAFILKLFVYHVAMTALHPG